MAQRLAERDRPPLILDGGLATELERRGQDVSGALWSARILASAPDQIQAVHAAYFAAGAEVATTASYQATYAGFAAIGVDADQTTELLRRSVQLADQAREQARAGDQAAVRPVRQRWVAASVGPYGALLADGSEYRGDYGLTVEQLRAFHRPRLQVLAQALLDRPGLGRPVIAYPNTGEGWDAEAREWTGQPTLDAARAQAWRDDGARALGGCCRVGPALLSRIAEAVS
jgi:homocysteine S-methyltransferase